MTWLLQAGGAPSWFVVIFGLTALIAAARFAVRPQRRRLEFIAWLALSTLLSVGAATASDIAAVCVKVPNTPEWAHSPDLHLLLIEGLGEAMAPGILGFALLSLVAFLSALGVRRLPPGGALT